MASRDHLHDREAVPRAAFIAVADRRGHVAPEKR
jgi:hypothetical protein